MLGGISPRDRLIHALDGMESIERALNYVNTLGDTISFYKVGLELFATGQGYSLLAALGAQNKKVFLDLKLFDIPRTVGATVQQIRHHASFNYLTVYGDHASLAAAVDAAEGQFTILAVTVLTSVGAIQSGKMSDTVLRRTEDALNAGCGGIIASGQETSALRKRFGTAPLIITPGIRHQKTDDHKRTTSVEQALRAGADHIVIGRPIYQSTCPSQMANDIQKRIAAVCAHP